MNPFLFRGSAYTSSDPERRQARGLTPSASQRQALGLGRSLVAPLLLLVSAACSVRESAEWVFVGKHFTLTAGVPYEIGPRHSLDVYRPVATDSEPRPVVVFLYGGRWQTGAKAEYRLAGDALTRRGYIAVIPDYRLAPAVKFPEWIDDAAKAIRWVRDSIASYGGDTARVFVVGHSAGAHTATILNLDDRYLARAGVHPEFVKGYVSLAGPVDTVWTDADVQALMGPPDGWPATYPSQLASSSRHAPLLLLHGAKDLTVLPGNSTGLAKRIATFGGCARAMVYPNLPHISIVAAFMIPRLPLAPVMNEVDTFIRQDTARRCAPASPAPAPTPP